MCVSGTSTVCGVRKSRLVPCPATELICVLDEPLYPSDHIFIIWKIDVLRILPKYLYQQDIVRTKRIRDNKCLQTGDAMPLLSFPWLTISREKVSAFIT